MESEAGCPKSKKPFHELKERGKRRYLQAEAQHCRAKQAKTSFAACITSNQSGGEESQEYDADMDDMSIIDEPFFDAAEDVHGEGTSNIDQPSVSDEGDSDFFYDSSDSECESFGEGTFEDAFASAHHEEAFKNFEEDRSLNVFQLLIQWALMYKVKMNALSALLSILKQFPNFTHLPSDARTLLKTPLADKAKSLGDGQYYHFGLLNCISSTLKRIPRSMKKLKFVINCDGLPLFKSTDSQFWPILISIVGLEDVCMAGLYHGYSKPEDAEAFLKEFIQELKSLIRSGVLLPDGRNLPVEVYCVSCDAPAKSFVLGCKGHTGYFSCTRCTQKGEWRGRVVFLETNAPARTHNDFLMKTESNFHHKPSIFESVPGVDMIRSFCLDYLHVVLLGVQRKMLKLWVLGKVPYKLSANSVFECSQHLYRLRTYIPAEFCRKPRDLNLIKRWKGTELRQFLLYTGPVVLKSVLEDRKYENFLVLSVAMRILLCPSLVSKHGFIQYARELLLNFVQNFQMLYSSQFITHNFHNLIHLADDAERFGHLDLVSTFKFENFLQTLKNMVRKPSGELMQVIRRTGEKIASKESQKPAVNSSQGNDHQLLGKRCIITVPFDDVCEPHYSTVNVKGFKVSTNKPDSCVGTSKNEIIVVEGISFSPRRNCQVIVGRSFTHLSDFFTVPFNSSLVGIYKVDKLSPIRCWPISEITMKYVLLPHRTEFVALPLLHSDGH